FGFDCRSTEDYRGSDEVFYRHRSRRILSEKVKGDFKIKALILAAGYATRLYPLTKEFPKPLLKIKDRPIIDYIIAKLNAITAIDGIFIVTNNKFIGQFQRWKKSVRFNKRIVLVNDLTKSNSDRLGAIGDINFVIEHKQVNDDLLVIGGDNLFSANLKLFLSFGYRHKPGSTIGVYKLGRVKDAAKYGVVKLNRSKQVIEFAEKPRRPKSNLVAMCLYYIPKEHLGLVKDYMKLRQKKVDATGKYIDWLKGKINTYGFIFQGRWYDVGDHKYLKQAKENFA
ncbi:MAG: nucleotidyltransferase family protein, partial [Candidatus Omnitrophica bacterium]|nr:nucleotidyltransferase family protein [Candidatus Omnitrophota bacterium]